MKRKTVRYTDDKGEIIGELRRIKDDLPSPDELADIVSANKSHAGAGQRFPGIFQAGSASAQYQLSADDPQSGALICACPRFGEANVIALPRH